MNNNQFRRLVFDTPNPSKARDARSPGAPSTSPGAATGPAGSNALGSRLRPNIPMTPRNLQGVNFARQLAESRAGGHPQKRFKSSSAPKGAKLPTGYQDRAALRGQTADDEEAGKKEDVEARVRALEELVQKGELDRGTFEKLRTELGVGGDVGSTHLVKGLDWELLRRVKAGEDVDAPPQPPAEEKEEEDVEDVDDALERALEEIPEGPVEKETAKKKKGNMAPPRRSRDEILREFRASRAAAVAPPPEPALGDKFKRISAAQPEKQKQRFVEVDEATGRRREVLVITEADGKSKRKTRWLDPPGTKNPPPALLEPRKDAQPLGMAVPAEIAAKQAAAAAEDEDDDIFAGAGNDYNVADELGADESGSEDSEGEVEGEKPSASTDQPPPTTNEPARPRNYFSNTTTETPDEPDRSNPLTRDPTLLAALKRAAALRQAGEDGEDGGEGGNEEGVDAATALRRKKFLEEARRREAQDDADMDLGFGSSRIEDDEDEEGIVLEEERGGRSGNGGRRNARATKTVRRMCWGCCEDDNPGDDPLQGGQRLDQP
ncbi:hypothetical protein P168DRAFT_282877 [Aspergillus campestris IBT 28561]|uniref:RED-like N-terminal domain-containing protein n=1 Tax=Aspergillus campestris (strain IBT 28561) TaxID=1392248 RepID=A0A2I1CZP9_ASPC2|nr:uncharacterized protein P168DRAFT_282877 [Aspergillus campestris IBT 28561]PKY03105.1 hypothetical protein P168DRAFT_282877 [Aspergillus campestris IBT 28561]